MRFLSYGKFSLGKKQESMHKNQRFGGFIHGAEVGFFS
jgi:hypothetical protein